MKHHTSLHFRTVLSLEDLASLINLQEPIFDCENETEWVIGVCDGVDKIDICRSHLVPPQETDTSVIRYASGMERIIPTKVIQEIAKRLLAFGINEIEVIGFDTWGNCLTATATRELGL